MARIEPVPLAETASDARAQLEQQIAAGGRATNMKRTLARAPVALHAYLHWYDLYAEVAAFLGPRLATLFAHAISTQTDCLICSTFFRRWLAEAGENPDALRLDEREQAVIAFGRQLARDANGITDEVYQAVASHLQPEQVITLTAFGGLMVATNLFNNALRVDLDEYLLPFRKGANP